MSRPSEAVQRAVGDTIVSCMGLICEAYAAHEDEVSIGNFTMNVLVNAMAKAILSDAAAECAVREESDVNAVRVRAAMKAAKFLAFLPDALAAFIEANAAHEAANANLVHRTNVAAEQGSVQ